MSSKTKNSNTKSGSKNTTPTTVTPTLQNITVKANDTAPTQNTGDGKTPPQTK
ncbi:MAG TPA: hypothetical protein VNS58_15960 [Puia sp.]|nr:hypothetical protein [Puia sp.]